MMNNHGFGIFYSYRLHPLVISLICLASVHFYSVLFCSVLFCSIFVYYSHLDCPTIEGLQTGFKIKTNKSTHFIQCKHQKVPVENTRKTVKRFVQ